MAGAKLASEKHCEVHGYHLKWRLRPVKGTWTCLHCRRQARFLNRAEKNYKALKAIFGKELADQYMEKVKSGKLPEIARRLDLK